MKMRMRIAILFLTPMLLFRPISGSLMAAEPAKVAQPAIVFQVKSIEELSGILTATAKRFLPDDESKALEPVLSRWISKLKGVDSKKPLGIYATIGEELSKGDFSTSFIVILVPVSDQKAFLEYLGSLDLQTQKQEEEYELTPVPFPTSLKFRDGYAYFVIARVRSAPRPYYKRRTSSEIATSPRPDWKFSWTVYPRTSRNALLPVSKKNGSSDRGGQSKKRG